MRWVARITHPVKDELASWASILGTVVSFLGLIQSKTWLTAVGLLFVALSIITLAYARRERRRLRSAAISVEGRSLDSLNVANLRRRVNRSLLVQRADHMASIEGEDL